MVMKIIERSVQEIGESLLVSLPKGWTKTMQIKKGSMLKMLVAENGRLLIAPEFTQPEKKSETTIAYDEHFERKFFREYFGQYEKIHITFTQGLSDKERRELGLFLQRFMNVQIIEESRGSIVVKAFAIQELSIEECMKRMHFLSLNMFEEKKQGSKTAKLQEMRDTMTRFYYMLIMQVRRFLTEGKYTEENQIPLIKAMDIRMVAEKMQRIAEHIINMKSSKTILFEEIEDYYADSFRYYSTENFDKASLLWKKGNLLWKKYEEKKQKAKQKKDFEKYETVSSLQQITRLAKEISMLVR